MILDYSLVTSFFLISFSLRFRSFLLRLSVVVGLEYRTFFIGAEYIPNLKYLQNPSLRRDIRSRVGSIVLSSYSSLQEMVFDPKHQYDQPDAILYHSGDQIATLLDIGSELASQDRD